MHSTYRWLIDRWHASRLSKKYTGWWLLIYCWRPKIWLIGRPALYWGLDLQSRWSEHTRIVCTAPQWPNTVYRNESKCWPASVGDTVAKVHGVALLIISLQVALGGRVGRRWATGDWNKKNINILIKLFGISRQQVQKTSVTGVSG